MCASGDQYVCRTDQTVTGDSNLFAVTGCGNANQTESSKFTKKFNNLINSQQQTSEIPLYMFYFRVILPKFNDDNWRYCMDIDWPLKKTRSMGFMNNAGQEKHKLFRQVCTVIMLIRC